MPPRRNLLIAFDAFGTLFQPRRPIAQQYSEVARSVGLTGFKDEDVEREFRSAFKRESKQNPNYGKANGMHAAKWWKKIIENTFTPLVGSDPKISEELAPRLLYRFSTEEGYAMFPDATALLRNLPKNTPATEGKVIVGVVTNSDDRVSDVLISLGLRVSPFRYGHDLIKNPSTDQIYDIDFSVMSYDIGYEKPDRRIFEAAEDMLWKSHHTTDTDQSSWDMLYVGDDYDKDIVGALNAGWHAVWINRGSKEKDRQIEWFDEKPPGELESILQHPKPVGFSNLTGLSRWLPRSP